MPSTLMKPDRDQDFYVVWSSVTESPHWWGSRTELIAAASLSGEVSPDRFDRADEFGTSVRWNYENEVLDHPTARRWLDWDDPIEIYQQQGTVARHEIRTLCERIERGQPVDDLLAPFDDDETPDGDS